MLSLLEDLGSTPSQGAKIPQAVWCGKKKKSNPKPLQSQSYRSLLLAGPIHMVYNKTVSIELS